MTNDHVGKALGLVAVIRAPLQHEFCSVSYFKNYTHWPG